ncbi:hypothetical protein [Listeria ilorinensis]|uniref:hypothetical protein n=1 Tax=Listeria ilorinensis TaxID=2867439 RepID=UPI001EF3E532|nr:hypothetical protein [Listeria ilorinensis]
MTIPWNRLISSYGTAEEIPDLLKQADAESLKRIGELIEHQETFWAATPWTVQALVQRFDNWTEREHIYQLFSVLAEIIYCHIRMWDIAYLSSPEKLLAESRLLPENSTEKDQEQFFEEDEISEAEFGSYYYYTFQEMRRLIPVALQSQTEKSQEQVAAKLFLESINPGTIQATCILYPEQTGGRKSLPDLTTGSYRPHLKLFDDETLYGIQLFSEEAPVFEAEFQVELTCIYRDSLDYTPLIEARKGYLYEGPQRIGELYFESVFVQSTDEKDV